MAVRLLTLKKSAERLGTSLSTVRQIVADGEIPVVRLGAGGKFWIDAADLDQYILDRKVKEIVSKAV